MSEEQLNRRLTTIVAADIAGYSRLTAIAEEDTLVALRSHRSELIDPRAGQYQGRIANTAGDSILLEFPSAVQAIRFAVDIQKGMLERNRSVPEDRRILFRIGINIGDVIEHDGDLLGDGVNVAARLESLAAPGGICVSSWVRDQALNRIDIKFQDLGDIEVKNIPRPIRSYQVVIEGGKDPRNSLTPSFRKKYNFIIATIMILVALIATGLFSIKNSYRMWGHLVASPPIPPGKNKPIIAVLPFDNLGGDPNQIYFANGITEDVLTDLSKVSGLFVLARGSTAVYRERPVSIAQVAKELGASHILQGSVRRGNQSVRVAVQLIDAKTNTNIWADRYDSNLKGMLQLQDELTKKIVSALAVRLTDDERARFNRTRGVVPEAYDTLLRGLELLRRYTPSTIVEGRALFQKATEIDPDYARAYANISFSYAISVFAGYSSNPPEDLKLAIKFGERARALDPEVPQVYFSLSNAYWQLDQVDKARANARRALVIDPNYADAYANLAALNIYAGNAREGLKAIEMAMRLNPRHPFFYLEIKGRAHFALGDYAAAARSFKKALEKNPNFTVARRGLASTYAQMGRLDDANWEIEETLTMQPGLTLSSERRRPIFKKGAHMERYLEGLRKAGLPE